LGGGINSHKIFDEIISLENLFSAWREFRRGKRNKPDVQEFELNLEDNIFNLRRELEDKTYQHSPYASFYIKDPKLRNINKASVKDRLLHHAVFRKLYPIFDKTFIYDSYSCRIGKGTHKAVNRLEQFCRKLSKNNHHKIFALKCDIKKFFDSVNQEILLELIKKKISDESTFWFVEKIIKSFKSGLPLGNVTSQLFANIYLNELDQFIKNKFKIKYYLRYCDDFIILSRNKEYLLILIPFIQDFLQVNLRLSLHPDKIILRKYSQGFDFLGYVVLPHHRVLRTKTKRRILKRIKREKISEQNLQSYFGVLKHCNGYKIKQNLLNLL